MQSFHVIIPARYQSSRFPGKLLETLHGKTILAHTFEQAKKAKPASLVIATDHPLIFEHAKALGAECIMTSNTHETGTDRLSEVASRSLYEDDAIIVNVQGDEPFIHPESIQEVALLLNNSNADMATLCAPILEEEDFFNPNIVKVVRDNALNALYFSRAPIPFVRDNKNPEIHGLRHIGLYGYRAGFLRQWTMLPESSLEALEYLEQLRVLSAGYKIIVGNSTHLPVVEINTPEDLMRAYALSMRMYEPT